MNIFDAQLMFIQQLEIVSDSLNTAYPTNRRAAEAEWLINQLKQITEEARDISDHISDHNNED